MLRQIGSELLVFLIDSVLTNIRQQKERNEGAQDAQRARHKEGILAGLDYISVLVAVIQDSQDLIAYKSTDFADCSCDTVVLASDSGCAGFGGYQADVVAWSEPGYCQHHFSDILDFDDLLSKGKEDAVDDYETSDVGRAGKIAVHASHDESDDALSKNTNAQSQLGTQPVTDKGATNTAWEVEEID